MSSHAKSYDEKRRAQIGLVGTSSITRLIHLPNEEVKEEFFLRKVTAEQVLRFRKSGNPGFVLKMDGELYYAEVPKDFSLLGTAFLGQHQCGIPCGRISELPDEKGGCEVIRHKSSNLERHACIEIGYETFNTYTPNLVVTKCNKYTVHKATVDLPRKKRNSLILSLAQEVCPGIESLDDLRKVVAQ